MNPRRAAIFAVFLLAALLLAQSHSFAENALPHLRAHSCPICLFGVWAIPAPPPALSALSETHRLEIVRATTLLAFSVPQCISPRAPPAL